MPETWNLMVHAPSPLFVYWTPRLAFIAAYSADLSLSQFKNKYTTHYVKKDIPHLYLRIDVILGFIVLWVPRSVQVFRMHASRRIIVLEIACLLLVIVRTELPLDSSVGRGLFRPLILDLIASSVFPG